MAHGKVKWFNSHRGFGFIEQSEGPDLFIHFKAIKDSGFKSLNEGDVVEYNVAKGPKGDIAADVRIVSQNPTPKEREPQLLRTSRSRSKQHGDRPFNSSLEDQLKALRKSSKENQQDLANRLKRR
ncbi:MAG TPA: cold shock domain-containing protein [Anaerolineae bacterium]|nr:cold shock domain-containing protein [Anaerolineae bacterium]